MSGLLREFPASEDPHAWRRAVDVAIRLSAVPYLGALYGEPPQVFEPCVFIPFGIVHVRGQPRRSDCSTTHGGIVMAAFPGAKWTAQSWKDFEIEDGTRAWSSIDAVVNAGIGTIVPAPVAGGWHSVQGWSHLDAKGHVQAGSEGHSVLLYRDLQGVDLILQASSGDGRVEWTERTFDQHKARYDEVRLALLG